MILVFKRMRRQETFSTRTNTHKSFRSVMWYVHHGKWIQAFLTRPKAYYYYYYYYFIGYYCTITCCIYAFNQFRINSFILQMGKLSTSSCIYAFNQFRINSFILQMGKLCCLFCLVNSALWESDTNLCFNLAIPIRNHTWVLSRIYPHILLE